MRERTFASSVVRVLSRVLPPSPPRRNGNNNSDNNNNGGDTFAVELLCEFTLSLGQGGGSGEGLRVEGGSKSVFCSTCFVGFLLRIVYHFVFLRSCIIFIFPIIKQILFEASTMCVGSPNSYILGFHCLVTLIY